MGRPHSDNRAVTQQHLLDSVLWTAWRDLSERFGPWLTMYQRFRDWRIGCTFDQILDRFYAWLNQEGVIDLNI